MALSPRYTTKAPDTVSSLFYLFLIAQAMILAAARPLRQLHQSQPLVLTTILSNGKLNNDWTDWSWSSQRGIKSGPESTGYCLRLDPNGALSLKYEDSFEIEQNLLLLSLQKIDKGGASLAHMHIQMEGCADEEGGYTISPSRTLSEALEASLDPTTSQELIAQLENGEKIDLSLPLQIFNRPQGGTCTYNRITFGRCIHAQAQKKRCDIPEKEMKQEIGVCVQSMEINTIG